MIQPREGVVIAGRYTLLRPLEQGGMGSVWVARHHDLDVDVAVKFMGSSLVASADARARFEREARLVARLGSQHVVKILDYGVEDETPFMVMELLRGESLWTRLSREGSLTLPVTARLVVQVCKALRTAHEAGLVHRDLKPGNVFLAVKDEDEVAIVLDFGIAKTTSLGDARTGTESGMLLGSAHYMSPEQIRSSRKVDHRSDLWSFGVILYRILVGRLPFPGEDFGDVLVRVCTDPLPLPSAFAPDLPSTADAFFARALARDADGRFQSARELAEAFSAMALAESSSRSEPPAPLPRSEPAEPRSARWQPLSTPEGPASAPVPGSTTILLPSSRPPAASPEPDPVLDPYMRTLRLGPSTMGQHGVPNPVLQRSPPPEALTGPLPALSMPVPAVPVRQEEPTRVSARVIPPRRSLRWPVWAALGAATLAGIVGVSLRAARPTGPASGSTALPPPATVSSTAPPAAAREAAPPAAAHEAAPPPIEPPPTAASASAAVEPAAVARAPQREKAGELIRRNPFSEAAPGPAPSAQPKGPAAPKSKPSSPALGPLELSPP